jgi:hypothetical protein
VPCCCGWYFGLRGAAVVLLLLFCEMLAAAVAAVQQRLEGRLDVVAYGTSSFNNPSSGLSAWHPTFT